MMTPTQAAYYLTEEEHDRYMEDHKSMRKAQAAVKYWEALARLRETQGERKRPKA